MGIIRDSFVIFKNWAEAINTLPEEYQLETYKALVNYGLNGVIPDGLSPVAHAMLISFSTGMENNILRYNASVENGKKGGRPKKEITQENLDVNLEEIEKPYETQQNLEKPSHNLTKPNETQPNLDEPNPNLNVNVNDNVNVNNISLSINKNNNYLDSVRACAREEELEQIFTDHFKDYFYYWGFDKEDKQTFNEVIQVLSQAVIKSRAGELRYFQMLVPLDELCRLIDNLDEQDIHDIVWQVLNNQDIRDRYLYILGALLNRAKEKALE